MARRDYESRLNRGVYIVAAVVFAVLLGAAGGYGPHRDELYFLRAGESLAWGYPDQGPVTPALAALMSSIAPESLTVLRLPSALASAGIVVLTAAIALELGARGRGQLIAAATVGVGSIVLIVGHLLSTTTFDLLAWAAFSLLAIKAVRRDERFWLGAGLVLGLALLNKPLPAFLAAALIIGVAIAGPRALFRSPWAWAGAAIALAIWSPWLIWQAREGWPQLDVAEALAEGGSASSEPTWALLPFQALLISPLLVGVWVAGLWALFRDPELRDLRFLGWTWVALVAMFSLTQGKPYYLAGMFPVLIAAGAPVVEGWLERGRTRVRQFALTAALVLSGAGSAVLALPILPEEELEPVLAANEDVAETVGWPELVEQVVAVHARTAAGDGAVIITENYGEAGAVDYYGPALGLPQAYSGHNGYWSWGPPPDADYEAPVIAVGFDAEQLDELRRCAVVDEISNPAEVENEELGMPIWLCAGTARPWSEIWPGFRHLG